MIHADVNKLNKQMREEIALPWNRIPINKCRRNERNKRLPTGQNHSSDYYRQEPSVDTKISK